MLGYASILLAQGTGKTSHVLSAMSIETLGLLLSRSEIAVARRRGDCCFDNRKTIFSIILGHVVMCC